jgi:sigma-B regulation protein RsbU (phosphoserine phosphatase)
MVSASGFGSIASRLIFWVASVAGLLFAAAIVYSFLVSRDLALENASKLALETAQSRANQVEEVLRSIEEGTRVLAATLEETTVARDELERVIRAFVAGNPRVYGSTAAVSPEISAFAPYFHRKGSEIVRADLTSDTYRYWERDWYTSVASTGVPAWSEPYFDEGGGNVLMVTYSVPVSSSRDGQRKLLGVVTADLSLQWLSDVVRTAGLGFPGYAVVLSRQGHVLAHPDPNVVASNRSVLEQVKPEADPKAREIVRKMLQGEKGFVPYYDLYLGKRARAAFQPVGSAGWSFGVAYPEAELLEDVHGLARTQLAILVAGLAALVGLVAVLSGRLTRPLRELSASATRIATGDLDLALPPITSRDEVGKLTGAFHEMRDSLKSYIHNLEVTTKAKQRLESELEIARRIQMDMLPAGTAGGGLNDGYELSAILEPARHVGGDLYDHFRQGSKMVFVVGDVSGKGVAAALFMARAKTAFQAVASREPDLGEVLRIVNRGLCEENEQGMFVTLFAGSLDAETGELTYASAGHDAPVLLPGGGGSPRFLELDGGPVLGLLEVSDYPLRRTRLLTNDTLVLYTDGVSEATDENGAFFSLERLVDVLAKSPGGTITEVTDTVLDKVKAFAGQAPQSDDITVMAVRCLGRTD